MTIFSKIIKREIPAQIVYEDEHILVIDKPAGIATTSPDGRNCLTWLVARLDPRAPHTHPSSRLDRDVTGVVIFARTRLPSA